MKSLKHIFVEYEIGEIQPENLPSEIYRIIEFTDLNDNLLKLSNLFSPNSSEISELIYSAFGITENDRLSKTEKLTILINRFLNNKLDARTLMDRIKYFELENCLNSESLETFLMHLSQIIYGAWVPSDTWEGTIEDIEKDLNEIENRYSEFLIQANHY